MPTQTVLTDQVQNFIRSPSCGSCKIWVVLTSGLVGNVERILCMDVRMRIPYAFWPLFKMITSLSFAKKYSNLLEFFAQLRVLFSWSISAAIAFSSSLFVGHTEHHTNLLWHSINIQKCCHPIAECAEQFSQLVSHSLYAWMCKWNTISQNILQNYFYFQQYS